jgi:chemotaxis protein CheD
MSQIIKVGTADFKVAKAPVVLESQGIGSCVVTCLYDSTLKIGAVCHIILPTHSDDSNLNPRRFADTALPLVFAELERLGCQRARLVAYLVGGASMFQHLGDFINSIGSQNVTTVKQIITQRGIRIVGLDVGGTRGRNVILDLDSGKVTVAVASKL